MVFLDDLIIEGKGGWWETPSLSTTYTITFLVLFHDYKKLLTIFRKLSTGFIPHINNLSTSY